MRVLVVARYKASLPNHIAPFVAEQAEALRKEGCTVDFFLIQGNYVLQRGALLTKIRAFRPDLVHAHYGLSAIPALLQRAVPVVVTFHNGESLHWYVNLLTSLFSLRASHVIYVAQHIHDRLWFRPRHYTILPCGIDLTESRPEDFQEVRRRLQFAPQTRYILFGGSFDNLRKNYPLLQQAIGILKGRGYAHPIEVREMRGLTRQQTTDLMNACNLFALPTHSEGSPQALKEAMACNCPILATDVADIKHLLGDVAGHYICSFDPAEVADQLERALSFEGRTQGRSRIDALKLSNVHVAQQLIEIYHTVLQA